MSAGSAPESGARIPVVRHFIACEDIVLSADGKHWSLSNLIHAIRPAEGNAYPLRRDVMCIFALLSDGTGTHSFQIQLVLLSNEEEAIWTTAPIIRDLGPDPLVVQGWPIRLRNVPFLYPGLYELRLLCDGREIAREPLLLKGEAQ